MIYLDNNATTRPVPEVAAAVAEAMSGQWCNASSVHRGGQDARHAVEMARAKVAGLIGVSPKGVTFTSCGTESIDLAVRGSVDRLLRSGREPPLAVVSTRVEHAAVRGVLTDLESRGLVRLTYLEVDVRGEVRGGAGAIDETIAPGTSLVSVQWANNETGVVMDVGAIGARCRAVGAVFHCDGTQWVGKMPVDLRGADAPAIDLLSFSAHKWHGPKGVGVLWSRPGVGVVPRLMGTQEGGLRGGTEDVPAIVGAGVAAEIAGEWVSDPRSIDRGRGLRDRFERGVLDRVPGAVVNGATNPEGRLWNTSNIGFPRLEAEALLMALSERGVFASAGAACSSGSLDPSPVLLAMGVGESVAHGSVRFSLSRQSTADEIEAAVGRVALAAARVGSSMPG